MNVVLYELSYIAYSLDFKGLNVVLFNGVPATPDI